MLNQIYQKYKSTNSYFSFSGDKGSYHSYIEFYEKKFINLQSKKVKLLEIGVYDGKSLSMFGEYFHNGKMYGVDLTDNYIDSDCKQDFILQLGHQSKHSTYKNFPKFDIIIDDGSGKLKNQVDTLKFLYFKLKFNGHYYIEDIGDLDLAKNDIISLNRNAKFYDFRNTSNRFDDVLIEIKKPINFYTINLHFFCMLRYFKNVYKIRQ